MSRSFALACALAVAATSSALAHHSAGAIDRAKSVTLNGTVKEFRWTNPHSWIDLDVANDKGVVETWSVEMTSPTFLVRSGWKSTTIKAGDKVQVVVRPLRSGEPGGVFVSITLPDGKILGERPATTPTSPN